MTANSPRIARWVAGVLAALGLCTCTLSCSNRRAQLWDDGRAGVLDAAGPGGDALGFCTGASRLSLGGHPTPISSIDANVTFASSLGVSQTVFRFAIGLQAGSAGPEELYVEYASLGSLSDKTTLLDGYGLGASLGRCISADCSKKQLLDRLLSTKLPEVESNARVAGWIASSRKKRRVTLCLSLEANDPAAHPRLAAMTLFLDSVEASFKQTQIGE